ncbi:hypothetical protein ACQKKE_05365 [Desemzia incerta]|uniref:hypothetical protein n=1 Tax=Desemzia incerta TaxID=82801 RepID=UPI003D05895C
MTWEYLDKINAILGIVSFLISFVTLLVSFRVNKRVNEMIDRVSYREEFKRHLGIAKSFLDMLDAKPINTHNLQIGINDFAADVNSKYSFLPKKISKQLTKLTEFEFPNVEQNIHDQMNIRKQIIELINYLEKESKK